MDASDADRQDKYLLPLPRKKKCIPTAKDQKSISIKAIDVAGDDYPDTFDEEGRTLSIEQRKEQCKPVAHTVWFNTYSQEKRDRIEADRIKFNLKKPGKKKERQQVVGRCHR